MSGWIKKSSMRSARSHFAIAVHKGKIYVFGGGGTDFKSLNSTEIYDPQKDSWTDGKDMSTTRSGAVAAELNNKIYVMGGGFRHPDGRFEFFKIVEVYDPESDTWSEGPDMLMPHDYPACAVINNHIYVLGGHHPDATKGGPMTDPGFSFCEVLGPDINSWQEIAPMPTPRFAFSAVVINNKIVALGGAGLRENGFKNFDVAEAYDPLTDRWDNAGFKLPWPAAGIGACVNNNRLYIAGGNSGRRIENRCSYLNSNLNKWNELDPMEEGRIVMGTISVQDAVYIIGGRGTDAKIPLNTVYAYKVIS